MIFVIMSSVNTEIDLYVCGFPCQAFSNIGHKKGFDDPRGEMIFEVFKILKNKKPKAFILENVKGLVSHDKGKTLGFIIETLDKLGYNTSFKVLEAKDYGLPQIRKRLFIVGVKKSFKKQIYNV